ncbi:autotransporter secretion outer membrane protein TamA [Salinihabitans flavidus]|uniref:Autotransporter secretion outer membrane protein TamA n=1 Tax=Salinihabitans flavidus TaxID=569882 RepID=A0A1H8PRE6_9RHOB|nr:BamA/TamA family outer membrane protein [Salinihabitans flavidus]SEO44520.1 autotransporter secretion outer membrane protein TamA [Salinihabitans flavidus]
MKLPRLVVAIASSVAFLGVTLPAHAFETFDIRVIGTEESELRGRLLSASALSAAQRDNVSDAQDVMSAALSDYTRMLETLYASGYYGGTVSIRVDGREAAQIPPLQRPDAIQAIEVRVDPGPPFRFGVAQVAPLPGGVQLPEAFRRDERARADTVRAAVDTGVEGWRKAGHAKVEVADSSLTADHARQILDARVRLLPGPLVRFGSLRVTSQSNVRQERIRQIAGLPEGERFSPEALEAAARRLRRTGAFRSVALSEGETLGPGNTMDVDVQLVDEKPRRFGAGAELSSLEGLTLSGFWLHRNLLGGAERFRVDAEVSDIGARSSGMDFSLGARLERPAIWGPDTDLYLETELEYLDEPAFRTDRIMAGIGARWRISETLTFDQGIAVEHERVRDVFARRLGPGRREITLATFPARLTWDRRDDILDATDGTYLRAGLKPFVNLGGSADGARLSFDGRAYRSLDGDGDFVLAGRMQFGALFGPSLNRAPADYLFYSGGGGTVRGHPYQSLGVDLGGGDMTGGRSFVGLSMELRARVSGNISVVGFADAGYIGSESFYDDSGEWHSGGGVGLRYDTPVGPIRLDLAGPLSGDTGDGMQLYIGIGQAF